MADERQAGGAPEDEHVQSAADMTPAQRAEALAALAHEGDVRVRKSVAIALGGLADACATGPLLELLADEDEGVRVLAEAEMTGTGDGARAGAGDAAGGVGAAGMRDAAGEPERAGSRLDAACAEVVRACRLTARETDVLRLLARGRNAAYIQQELSLTRSTVKSYVADVYRKLDVHSHQELIDLVEGQRPSGPGA